MVHSVQAMRRRFAGWGILVALVVAEVALRLAGVPLPVVPHGPTVDQDISRDLPLNRLGLREKWQEPPPVLAKQCRVAVLGDSFAFGEGVPDADTLPRQLAQRLQLALPEQPVLVMNLGKPDNKTWQEVARYEALAPVLRPNVVLLVAYVNDVEVPNPAYTIADIYDADGGTGPVLRTSLLLSHLWARVRLAMMQWRTVALYRSALGPDAEQSLQDMFQEVGRLQQITSAHGARLALTLYPWLYRLDDYLLPDLHTKMAKLAAKENVPWLDLLPVFAHQPHHALRVSLANEHPNALAHRMAADALTPLLTRLCREVMK